MEDKQGELGRARRCTRKARVERKPSGITARCRSLFRRAIDALVEAGSRTTRSEAAAWLIHAGIDANKALLDTVYGTVAEIRRLRVIAQSLARDATPPSPDEKA